MNSDTKLAMKTHTRNSIGRLVANAERVLCSGGLLTRERLEAEFEDLDDQIAYLTQYLQILGGPQPRKTFFTIEGYDEDNPPLPGLTLGETWNGWAHPYFNKETALKLIKGPLGVWDDDQKAYYQEDTNQFILPTGDEDDPWLELDCEIIAGEPHWAIGAGWWCWDEADDPHLRDKLTSFVEMNDGYLDEDYFLEGIVDLLLECKEELNDLYRG